VAGRCEHDYEPSGSIKGGEFLDHPSNCKLLKNDSALWSYVKMDPNPGCTIMLLLIHSCPTPSAGPVPT
jgi:hypothetical protein